MKIQTAHFGEVEIDGSKVVSFPNGLPGLEDNKRYVLLANDESRPISWLQSLDRREISLPVIDPFKICPDYSFDIPQDDINAMEIENVKDVFVLNIMVIPGDIDSMTVNLSAPIIINVRKNIGSQLILDDRKYRVRAPVSELLGIPEKGGMNKCLF